MIEAFDPNWLMLAVVALYVSERVIRALPMAMMEDLQKSLDEMSAEGVELRTRMKQVGEAIDGVDRRVGKLEIKQMGALVEKQRLGR